ncbi:hypothetical protein E4U60_001327 [Claviceps pazoutovae]|uniref:Uncharacterized protein n=1 Tax=Claviceps pazoutovae TaxID=1649127 RepID=A0A9P7MCV3_9HYPO|nr:hypothetical protein E4U60_001327 [Claviceps pazoutovae]
MVSNGPETPYHLSASFDKTISPGIHIAMYFLGSASKTIGWLMLITPVVDVTLRNEESYKLSPTDSSLDIVGLGESIQLARGGRSVCDPRASSLLGLVDKLPPIDGSDG